MNAAARAYGNDASAANKVGDIINNYKTHLRKANKGETIGVGVRRDLRGIYGAGMFLMY